jgi:sulfate permease, SulP family
MVPQVMGYAAIAGLPPITGLWASLLPLVVYPLLGSSRRLSVGPESTTALMTATTLAALSGGDPSQLAAAAAALAITAGLVCLVARLLRAGYLSTLLSRPILSGYLLGIAVLMIASQLGHLTGLPVPHGSAKRLMVKPRSSPETQLPTIEPGCPCPAAHPRVMLGVTQCDPPTTRRRVQ